MTAAHPLDRRARARTWADGGAGRSSVVCPCLRFCGISSLFLSLSLLQQETLIILFALPASWDRALRYRGLHRQTPLFTRVWSFCAKTQRLVRLLERRRVLAFPICRVSLCSWSRCPTHDFCSPRDGMPGLFQSSPVPPCKAACLLWTCLVVQGAQLVPIGTHSARLHHGGVVWCGVVWRRVKVFETRRINSQSRPTRYLAQLPILQQEAAPGSARASVVAEGRCLRDGDGDSSSSGGKLRLVGV
ncbi:hypothetical protein BD289DRAFT_165136 [Coniella lustricola]|uniref:Uncharacterized protein n=1 Tax=Coniella lustricola TaxID=2025994 RepID=A0A2T2ZU79_9PEZI|nr:hypothetical protein BD289DRAFT_165136 [Coniella lustricola]